ncbi:hypothetical protein OFQ59_10190 [Brachyspira hyodysenteriae]|uniref:hypothetical protein n=1 Tax=Brachyspira hyodysenteriae TaxID=159 RepID=UPI0022CDEE7C|nr:hypothetical protein [Brachyspira hyodysenteriae]MCZ9970449.1 hypothetical protein [Brachyspira hyodysenteriae]
MNRLRLWIKNAGMEIKNYKYIDIVPMFCPNWFAHLLNFIAPIFEKTPVLKRLSCARVVIFSSKN